ncbi:MAG TPA: 50S ribosomal protein L18 [Spirochaetaceae bacterium]|nr:50S ribosomal protein L18 [Spirochaetaceae bacterium]
MKPIVKKNHRRDKRKAHIRKRVKGTLERPRVSVFRSNLHLYAQVIDDVKGETMCCISGIEKEYAALRNNVESAKKLGLELGKRMSSKNIKTCVFDRNGYKYHGIVKSFADGIREAGIDF